MAQYKFERFLKFSGDSQYDKVHPAGTPAPRAGIYRCDGCGLETTVQAGQTLPPNEHHEHAASQKLVRWKLIVAESDPLGALPQQGNQISRPARF